MDATHDLDGSGLDDDAPGPPPRLPTGVGVLGLVIASAAALPLAPDGSSFLSIVAATFRDDVMQGFLTLLGFGSPFLFGLALAGRTFAVGNSGENARVADGAMKVVLSFFHGQLLLVAGVFAWGGVGIARFALLAFAVVGGGYFIFGSAQARAESTRGDQGPSALWLARWGTSIIAGVCGWARLQMLAGLRLGIAVDVVLFACILVTWQIARAQRPS